MNRSTIRNQLLQERHIGWWPPLTAGRWPPFDLRTLDDYGKFHAIQFALPSADIDFQVNSGEPYKTQMTSSPNP